MHAHGRCGKILSTCLHPRCHLISSGNVESKTHDLITEQLVERLPALAIKAILEAVHVPQLGYKQPSLHHFSWMGICF